jgi:diaminohydroxyphosphoribosylaminopyrimidine deaminase/5-amino-6-(5-phosphoribosylamino)uracil reductase
MSQDEYFMSICLDLAQKAAGQTAPNPLVGAVIVADGEIVGRGHHERAGLPHAEPNALAAAGDKAKGATLYVNLEPCSHYGRTPPCADAVIAAGIKRVVVGGQDSNVKVNGGGIARLREAGIDVTVGVLADQCRYLNRGFFRVMECGLPWVELKMACTLDGRIADQSGRSRYITAAAALERVQKLRRECDAIMVGAATARLDDPSLTVRDGLPILRQPRRVVVDPHLTLDENAKIFDGQSDTFIFSLPSATGIKPDKAEFLPLKVRKDGGYDLKDCLATLAAKGVRRLLVEGGGVLAGALLDANLVDQIYWFMAPKMLVSSGSRPVLASDKGRSLDDIVELEDVRYEEVLPDLLVTGYCKGRKQFLEQPLLKS